MSQQVEIFLPRFIKWNQTHWKANHCGIHCPGVTSSGLCWCQTSLTFIRVCKQPLMRVKPRWQVQTIGVIVKVKCAQRWLSARRLNLASAFQLL